MRQLSVYVNDQHAGFITEQQPGRGYEFRYAPDYLHSDGGPVSLTLPKREEPYQSEHLFPFFTNLLPEGANRKAMSLQKTDGHYCQGPAEFIRTIRIKRGRALLKTSQMQDTDIAYAVGFTTVKSFTMNFKAEYGMTPTEFRNSNPPSSMS